MTKLTELIERLRQEQKAKTEAAAATIQMIDTSKTKEEHADFKLPEQSIPLEIKDKYGNTITLNEKQQAFVDLALSGNDCVLLGAAGTGKTTTQGAVVQELIHSGKAGILYADGHKKLVSGTPGIVVIAFTRRAVANIKRSMPGDMQNNCLTHHKLLEYEPVYYEVMDDVTGEEKTKMRFEATRNAMRALPSSIHTVIIEEGSMYATGLYRELKEAAPHKVQIIFLGDIQQLPPVFGPAILGYKLLELPVIELTEVYRQALESPIIRLAHRILSGKVIHSSEFPAWKIPGKLTIHPWKKKLEADIAVSMAAMFFTGNKHLESDPKKQAMGAHEAGAYNIEEDIILIPYNKAFGSIELNKKIAHYLAWSAKRVVYEVVAGFTKHYFSVGEKVMYDKEDAEIVKIERNLAYSGVFPQPASEFLDYHGHNSQSHKTVMEEQKDNLDFMLSQVSSADDKERVNQASHTVTLLMANSDREVTLKTAGEINALLLGYALTVHKAQGSEWRKVFFVAHQSHATMLQRELLYTAVTRAREELYIICEPETFVNGIKSQKVKGNTLAEKAEFFKGKLERNNGEIA